MFVKLLILLIMVQHAFADGGFCSPNVIGNQYITLTTRNETILNPSIQSPNYPNSYPNNIDCVWMITVPPGKKVKFTFTQMVLEYYSSDCTADYVELRSGLNTYSSRIGRYCGTSLPSARYSSGRNMWVKFHSDGSATRSGFSANYEAVNFGENPVNPHQDQGSSTNTSTSSSSSGSIGGSVSGIIFLIILVLVARCWWRRRMRPAVIIREVRAPAAAATTVVVSNINVNQQVAPPLQQQHPQAMLNPANYPPPQQGYAYHPPPQGYAYPPPSQGSPYPPPPQGTYSPPPPYGVAPTKQ